MSGRARIAAFALGLAAIFALAFGLGSAFDPADTDAGGSHGEMAHGDTMTSTQEETTMSGHEEHQATAARVTAGLSVAEGGYSLHLDPTYLEPGKARELHFRIEDPSGDTVRDFDELHERRMHLIVVRRDGAHFQHLHPEIDDAGTWTTALALPAPGVYRAFADFSVEGDPYTLASDLFASGAFEAQPFPESTPVDRVDGYAVRLHDGDLEAGVPSALRFVASKDGEEPVDLENYLGAKGHLVALREGDLAFLHVHPDGPDHEEGHGSPAEHSAEDEAAPNVVPYTATFPTAGRYRLFLQFKDGGQVRTAQYTVTVAR